MTATQIAHLLAERAESTARHLLPNGRLHANEWVAGSIHGEAGNSLKIRLTGSKAGVWADFGNPEHRGDLIALWRLARNVDLPTACKEALDYLNLAPTARNNRPSPPPPKPWQPHESWLRLQPTLRTPTDAELRQIATLRQLPTFAGLRLAADAEHLFTCEVFDDGANHPCWLITDPARRNAQARRLDGQRFTKIDSKSKTIKGCDPTWPIGIANARGSQLLLVEGAPDLLAAWHLVWATSQPYWPVCITGASNDINAEALPHFANRHTLIIAHRDAAGIAAARRWASSIPATIRHAPEGKDLNEFVTACELQETA